MIEFHLGNNVEVLYRILDEQKGKPFADCIYADCIYEDEDFEEWVNICYQALKPNGVFYVQTDYHTVANFKIYLDDLFGRENFINWLIYKQEWGGVPKKAFPRKHDDILMYGKEGDYKFYKSRIQIPKATAGTAFDKKGTGLKTPCDVFDDLGNFSTISKERIKFNDRNIQWQKPLKLMERLLLPVTDEGDLVLDPFSGSGTTAEWCYRNNRNCIAIENDKEIFKLSRKRIMELEKI